LDVWLGKTAEKILLWGDPPSRTSWDFRVPQPLPLPEEPAAPAQPQQDHQVVEEVPQLQPQPQPEHLDEVQETDDDEAEVLEVEPTEVPVKRKVTPGGRQHLPPAKRKRQTKKGGRDCAGML
jgi:hypothetical protein